MIQHESARRASLRARPDRFLALALVLGLAALQSGCLGEPPIEDRWTRLDILEVEPIGTEGRMPAGETVDLAVCGRIIFRNILTGAVAMEIRSSSEFENNDLDLRKDAPRFAVTEQISDLLEDSEVLARVSQNVTGFDHLIRDFEFEVSLRLPDLESGGLFAVIYFGEAEEMEMPNGEDVVIVTPADFEAEHILPGAKALWVE